jgi:prepilin-type processing-associated H-X9-DG protein
MKVLRSPGYTVLELLVVVSIVCVGSALLFPRRQGRVWQGTESSSCQSNLKQIGLAFMQYTRDYDERFPRAIGHAVPTSTQPFMRPYGWADALWPYMKSTQLLQCSAEENSVENLGEATAPNFTDYYLNSNLSGREMARVKQPTFTILVGEGNDGTDGTDARYNRNVVPWNWQRDENSPARRHLDGSNYLFADAHVKWFPHEATFMLSLRSSHHPNSLKFALR